jgi:hypothetical protein
VVQEPIENRRGAGDKCNAVRTYTFVLDRDPTEVALQKVTLKEGTFDCAGDSISIKERFLEAWAHDPNELHGDTFTDTHSAGPKRLADFVMGCCKPCCDLIDDAWTFKLVAEYEMVSIFSNQFPAGGSQGLHEWTKPTFNCQGIAQISTNPDTKMKEPCGAQLGKFTGYFYKGNQNSAFPKFNSIDPFPNPQFNPKDNMKATETWEATHAADDKTVTITLTSTGYK